MFVVIAILIFLVFAVLFFYALIANTPRETLDEQEAAILANHAERERKRAARAKRREKRRELRKERTPKRQ